MNLLFFICVIGYLNILEAKFFKWKSVNIYGKLYCNGRFYNNAVIYFKYKNRFRKSVFVSQSRSRNLGIVSFTGKFKKFFSRYPYMEIYHKCNVAKRRWEIKVTKFIPKIYITYGKYPKTTFNFGYLELNKRYPNQQRVFNRKII
uniref:Transthyretin-like family-containing protein n=1 Tax=Strongyloides stercoralis TaxID=6248 RepID=A0A0K0DZT9_STRER